MALNPSQQAVASNDHERAIVLAGAGTGKTTAAIHWIAERIKDGVKPHNILMVTFTKKAANQMRQRLTDVAGSDSKHCYIGTYHAITLSTIHSAKGLEWDSVILFNASGDIMPNRMACGDAELEEEKRLMYVALTRARYELLVTANDEMGGLSPFLDKVVHGTPIESTHELLSI
jgi:superfamily I DNA/RNA helicase